MRPSPRPRPASAALLAALALCLPRGLAAATPPLVLPDDPSPLLGLGLGEALELLGPPSSVAVARGDEAWQDDVVFVYSQGYQLSWAGDRLWRVRFAGGYAGTVLGLFLGDTQEKTLSLLGRPWLESGGALVFRLAWKGYPVRARVSLVSGVIAEIQVYRADF